MRIQRILAALARRQARHDPRGNRTRRAMAALIVVALAALATSPGRAVAAASGSLRADSLRWVGRYSEALDAYTRVAARAPDLATLGTARCLEETGRIDDAARALAAGPRTPRLAAERARLEFERGRYDSAQACAERALAADATVPCALFVRAELDRVAGRLDAANDGYHALVQLYNAVQDSIRDPDDLMWIGRGAAQYARWNRNSSQFSYLVNTLYPDALRLDLRYWPAHLEEARLFIEKFNRRDAAAELDSAYAINPFAAEVHAARARVEFQEFRFDSATAIAERALRLHPGLVSALLVQADVQLMTHGARAAVPPLERARATNPLDEAVLGRLAAAYGAIDGLRDSSGGPRMDAIVAAVRARNPHCGSFDAALAGALDLLQKYPQAAHWYEEARRVMPQLVEVPGQLGLVELRLANEAHAKTLLDESAEADPFNVRVRNSLEVLQVLAGYATLETPHFVLRYDAARDSLLARYAARVLEDEIWPQITQRMGWAPPGKSLIEIFASARHSDGHAWFSARLVGLPFVGVVAGCAGRIVGLTSPGDGASRYAWARVLRHEFVHVVNLQQTNFEIPHWFTEGLAVANEGAPPPPEWDPILARRMAAGKLFTLETIDLGFLRPATGDDWPLAYCQALLYTKYMQERWGPDGPNRMIAAYAGHLDTGAALERAFHVDEAAFEQGFHGFVARVVARHDSLNRTNPIDPRAWRDSVAAREVARDTVRLTAALERLSELDDDVRTCARLAELALARRDWPRAARWATAAIRIDVAHPAAHAALGAAAWGRGDAATAAEEYATALALDGGHDDWREALARARAQSHAPPRRRG